VVRCVNAENRCLRSAEVVVSNAGDGKSAAFSSRRETRIRDGIMAITFVCQSCQTKLRVPDERAGSSIRCPRCGNAVIVPEQETPAVEEVVAELPRGKRSQSRDDEDDLDERPAPRRKSERPRPKSKGGGKGLVLGLAIGGGCLALLLVFGVCGGLIWWVVLPERNPRLTDENIKKIQGNMTLDEAEQILGEAKKATDKDVQTVNKAMKGFGPNIQFRPGTTKYRWRNGNRWLFVDVDDRTRKIVGSFSCSYS
jgi:predicted RNA-binding Zn-ribbon protein involved in translation (DUF1610 family)